MGCGLFHHQASHRHASGKENIVKLLFQEPGVFLPAALHHRHIILLEGLADNPFENGRGCRRIGRGLNNTAVTCRNGSRRRLQGQHKGIIPGRHDKRRAVRLLHHIAFGMKLRQRRAHPSGFAPHGSVLYEKTKLAQG